MSLRFLTSLGADTRCVCDSENVFYVLHRVSVEDFLSGNAVVIVFDLSSLVEAALFSIPLAYNLKIVK